VSQLLVLLLSALLVLKSYAHGEWLTQMVAQQEKNESNTQYVPTVKKKGHDFFSQHGLVFFYASTCQYCHQFAPILKAWAEKNKVEVLALSFDNQPLIEFQHFLPATKEWITAAFSNNPIHYPAVFVADTNTHTLYPATFGALPDHELDARMSALIPKIIEYETTRGAR
jgi:type-F conjugative transfer system pilin assembly thiol-disulfide isomerase TrbB